MAAFFQKFYNASEVSFACFEIYTFAPQNFLNQCVELLDTPAPGKLTPSS